MSEPLRIGTRLHGGIEPLRCVELAMAAEANRFSSVWFAENPMERGVLPAAAACAAATRRIGIGIGVWNPYNRHPSLIAMEIGALDAVAQGRAGLGIGSGLAVAIKKLNIDHSKPLGALRDTFHIVRSLLRGETVSHTGAVFSVDGIKLGYTPPRPDFPLFMAARGAKALELCGEIADGLVISNMCPPGFAAHAAAVVAKGAAKAGRPAPRNIVHYVPCVANADGAAARRGAAAALTGMLKQYWALAQKVPAAKEGMVQYSGIPEADFQTAVDALQAGTPPEVALDRRFLDAFAVAGTDEECLVRIAAYGQAGVSDLVLTFVGPDPIADMTYLGRALPPD